MHRQLSIAVALIIAIVAGQARATVIEMTPSAAMSPAVPAKDAARTVVAVVLTGVESSDGGVSGVAPVFMAADVTGKIIFLPATMIATAREPSPVPVSDALRTGAIDACAAGCAPAPAELAFAAGTAAFQVANSIDGGATAGRYLLAAGEIIYDSLERPGMGNVGLVVVALICLALIRRRPHA